MGVEADGLSDTMTPSPVDTTDEMDRLEKVMALIFENITFTN